MNVLGEGVPQKSLKNRFLFANHKKFKTLSDPRLGEVDILVNAASRTHVARRERKTHQTSEARKFLQAMEARAQLRHTNINELLDYSMEAQRSLCNKTWVSTEYYEYPKSSLKKLIDIAKTLSDAEVTNLLYQQVTAHAFLEKKRVRPPCISSENIAWENSSSKFILSSDLPLTREDIKILRRDRFRKELSTFASPHFYENLHKNFADFSFDPVKEDVFCLGLAVLEAGTGVSAGELYVSACKFDWARLQAMRDSFSRNFSDRNLLVTSALDNMLELNEENRPTFIELLAAMPSYESIKPFLSQEKKESSIGGSLSSKAEELRAFNSSSFSQTVSSLLSAKETTARQAERFSEIPRQQPPTQRWNDSLKTGLGMGFRSDEGLEKGLFSLESGGRHPSLPEDDGGLRTPSFANLHCEMPAGEVVPQKNIEEKSIRVALKEEYYAKSKPSITVKTSKLSERSKFEVHPSQIFGSSNAPQKTNPPALSLASVPVSHFQTLNYNTNALNLDVSPYENLRYDVYTSYALQTQKRSEQFTPKIVASEETIKLPEQFTSRTVPPEKTLKLHDQFTPRITLPENTQKQPEQLARKTVAPERSISHDRISLQAYLDNTQKVQNELPRNNSYSEYQTPTFFHKTIGGLSSPSSQRVPESFDRAEPVTFKANSNRLSEKPSFKLTFKPGEKDDRETADKEAASQSDGYRRSSSTSSSYHDRYQNYTRSIASRRRMEEDFIPGFTMTIKELSTSPIPRIAYRKRYD